MYGTIIIYCGLAPTEPGDVIFGALMVTFPMGSTTATPPECVSVTGIPDMSAEGDEVVAVTIVPSAAYDSNNAPGGFTLTSNVNVLDNDGK